MEGTDQRGLASGGKAFYPECQTVPTLTCLVELKWCVILCSDIMCNHDGANTVKWFLLQGTNVYQILAESIVAATNVSIDFRC